MNSQDWFVNDLGECQPRPSKREWDLLRERYYLHQFLTEIIDLLAKAPNELEEWDFLPQIRMKVRQLVTNSYWVKSTYSPPNPRSGASVTTLYDEIGYPLTVQNVTTLPGTVTSVHNHGTWGVVFQIEGTECHRFWRRTNRPEQPLQIEAIGEHFVEPGQILSFHPQAIHQVQTVGKETSVTFQLYGDTQPKGRFQFDPETQTAKPF